MAHSHAGDDVLPDPAKAVFQDFNEEQEHISGDLLQWHTFDRERL